MPDGADDRVQQQDGRDRARSVGGRIGDARRQRDGVLGAGELLDEAVELRAFDVRRGHGGVDVRTGQGRLPDVAALAIGDGLREGEGEQALAARRGGDPLVGVRRGEILAGADRDQARAPIGVARDVATLRELPHQLDRGRARVEEAGSEVDHEIRVGEIEEGRRRHTEDGLARLDHRVLTEGRVAEATRDAGRRDELVEQAVEGGTDRTTEDPGLARAAPELGGELVLGVFPGDRLERSVAAARDRRLDAVRMIGPSDARLAARAQLGRG